MKRKILNIVRTLTVALALLWLPLSLSASDFPSEGWSSYDNKPENLQTSIKVAEGGVEISVLRETPTHVIIYTLTGKVVKNMTLKAGVTFIELPAGYYIVRVDGLSNKVVVK